MKPLLGCLLLILKHESKSYALVSSCQALEIDMERKLETHCCMCLKQSGVFRYTR